MEMMESRCRIARILLTCARELVATKLTDYQKKLIDEYAENRSSYLDFGNAFNWDANGRVYFPATRTIPDIQAPQEIVDALAKLGYSISSYRDGKAIKTIEVRDGKRTREKGIGKILKNEVHDDVLSREFDNRLDTSNKQENRKFLICITHNADDVGAMSAGRNWTSCMRLPDNEGDSGGAHHDTALRQVQYGGMCAYLIDPNDREIDNPYARIAIKRLENSNGGFIYNTESIIYGDEGLANECNMREIVEKELEKANEVTSEGGMIFTVADPESYSDSNMDVGFKNNDPENIMMLNEDEFVNYFSSESGLEKILKNKKIHENVKKYMSQMSNVMRKKMMNALCYFARENAEDKEDYTELMSFIDDFGDFIDWKYVSQYIYLDPEIIEKYRDKVFWPGILTHCEGHIADKYSFRYTEEDMRPFKDILDRQAKIAERNLMHFNDERFIGKIHEFLINTVNKEKNPSMNEFIQENEFRMGNSFNNHGFTDIYISNTRLFDIVEASSGNSFLARKAIEEANSYALKKLKAYLEGKGDYSLSGMSDIDVLAAIKKRGILDGIIKEKVPGHEDKFNEFVDAALKGSTLQIEIKAQLINRINSRMISLFVIRNCNINGIINVQMMDIDNSMEDDFQDFNALKQESPEILKTLINSKIIK